MALTADLVSTPLSLNHSPSATSAVLSTAQALLGEPSERFEDDFPETPSPCASKLSRSIRKHGRQNQRAIPYNRITKEFAQKNRSPKFAELIHRACGESSLKEATKQAVGGVDGPIVTIGPSSESSKQPREEIDHHQETQERSWTSPEKATPDKAYSSRSTESPPPPPLFTPKRHTIQEIFQDMSKVMQNSYKNNPGHAYILYDNLNRSPLFKLGSSTDIHHRVKEHQSKCQRPSWRSIPRPTRNIPAPARLERLAQKELKNFQCELQCSCGTEHTEYFWGSKEVGVEVLDFWSGWLQGKGKGEDKELGPYDRNGNLEHFWVDRLDQFEASLHEFFKCDNPQCAEKEEDAPACQACLRAGWRKWAEPTPADELDYACRMNIPSQAIRRGVQSINGLDIIRVSYLIASVNLIRQAFSVWRWMSDPAVFLCVIPLRLLSGWVEPRVRLPESASCWFRYIADMVVVFICIYTRLQYGGAVGFSLVVPSSSPSPSCQKYREARRRKRASLSGGDALGREGEVETPIGDETERGNGRTTEGASARRRST